MRKTYLKLACVFWTPLTSYYSLQHKQTCAISRVVHEYTLNLEEFIGMLWVFTLTDNMSDAGVYIQPLLFSQITIGVYLCMCCVQY